MAAPLARGTTSSARSRLRHALPLGDATEGAPGDRNAAKEELLGIIQDMEERGGQRGSSGSVIAEAERLDGLIQQLASLNPHSSAIKSGKLQGTWRLVYTVRSNTGLEGKEWLQYLIENGPSPIQRFVIGNVQQVGRVYQVLEINTNDKEPAKGWFNNFIDFRESLGGVLNLQAKIEGFTGETQLDIKFSNAYFEFSRNPVTGADISANPIRLPYPVPFRLLPNESRGLLDNIYVDDDLRLARGNKGTVFVLRREEDAGLPC